MRARDDTLHTLKLELMGLRVISTQSRAALLRRNTHIDILFPLPSLSPPPSALYEKSKMAPDIANLNLHLDPSLPLQCCLGSNLP